MAMYQLINCTIKTILLYNVPFSMDSLEESVELSDTKGNSCLKRVSIVVYVGRYCRACPACGFIAQCLQTTGVAYV